jgi:glucose/arabinose dehydrogenase
MDGSRQSRRAVLSLGIAALGSLAGCGGRVGTERGSETEDPSASGPAESVALATTLLADGFEAPVGAVPAGHETILVADQPGQLYRVDSGSAEPTQVLDITDQLAPDLGFEMGLLGLALHPDFPDDDRLFLRYSAPAGPETPSGYSHDFVLAAFAVAADLSAVSSTPETELLRIPQPQGNHNAGDIAFGPAGLCYVAVGDGGAAGDQGRGHASDWYDAVAGGNGQDVTENLLGSILRIDVDQGGPADEAYAVPADNPLVGETGLDEQYAWGFRNPWRFSFGPEGRLFVADVGQNRFEEVNVVRKGGNYGWNVREGTACFSASDCPDTTPGGAPLEPPIIEYPHDGEPVSGISVIGGYLYNGTAIPSLEGTYVFGDYRADGRLFLATEGDDGQWETASITLDGIGSRIYSFGRDASGELLVCTMEPDGESGTLVRLKPDDTTPQTSRQ